VQVVAVEAVPPPPPPPPPHGALQRLVFAPGVEAPPPPIGNASLLILSPVRNRGSGHKTPISHFTSLLRTLVRSSCRCAPICAVHARSWLDDQTLHSP
jgi:hypothetical protein